MSARAPTLTTLGSLLWLLASACTVGPNYELVEPPLAEHFGAVANDDRTPAERASSAPDVAWWLDFGDEQLVSLVERAAANNLEIEVAMARVAEARAFWRAQSGRLLPAVGAGATGGRQRASAQGPGPLSGLAEAGLASLENEQYQLLFDVGWELDLFGRVRRAREASSARLEGTIEAQRAIALLVAADVASAYVDLRGFERRIALSEHNLSLQTETLDVIDGKVEAGLLSPLDRERELARVATTRAAIAPLRTQREATVHRLSVLLGEEPRALLRELSSVKAVPEPPGTIATGLPAALLLRRPDLRRRERELHAATADVGAAIGERFPSVSIGGSRGFESADVSDLLESASRVWSYGPQIDLPVFQGGRLKAQVEAARARLEAARSAWQLSVLRALEEVETSLVGYEKAHEELAARREAASASRRATELASVLFEEGLRDHLVLLDAERSQTALDDALALAEIARAQRAIDLYRALGGGWEALEKTASDASHWY